MASIRKEIQIDAPPEQVWDALRDFGALHTRLVPGFVTDCRMEGADRIVTFANGATFREVLIDTDDIRRLVWSIVDEPYKHHNGAAQVFSDGEGSCRFVWSTDLLPNDEELVGATDQAMQAGIGVVKKTLEAD